MTTMTASLEALTVMLDVHDEDGIPTSIEIWITDQDDLGFFVEAIEDGVQFDSELVPTLVEAIAARDEMAAQIKADDRTRERNRICGRRQYAKEALQGVADELTGFEAEAARLLARIIASGKGEAAAAVLRSLAKACR